MVKRISTLFFAIMFTSQAYADVRATVVDGCMKSYKFHLSKKQYDNGNLELQKICECKANEVVKAGFNQQQAEQWSRVTDGVSQHNREDAEGFKAIFDTLHTVAEYCDN